MHMETSLEYVSGICASIAYFIPNALGNSLLAYHVAILYIVPSSKFRST